jgi:hypothetical protein
MLIFYIDWIDNDIRCNGLSSPVSSSSGQSSVRGPPGLRYEINLVIIIISSAEYVLNFNKVTPKTVKDHAQGKLLYIVQRNRLQVDISMKRHGRP